MPIVAPNLDAGGANELLFGQSGMGQMFFPPSPFPTPIPPTIAGSSNWNSGLIFNSGYRFLTLAFTSTQAGSCIITQYIDLAGTIARPVTGTPWTTPIVANTALIVDIADLKPFAAFTVQIGNSSGTPAVVSAFQLIVSAG